MWGRGRGATGRHACPAVVALVLTAAVVRAAPVPVDVSYGGVTRETITIEWTASTSATFDRYEVYRDPGPPPSAPIGSWPLAALGLTVALAAAGPRRRRVSPSLLALGLVALAMARPLGAQSTLGLLAQIPDVATTSYTDDTVDPGTRACYVVRVVETTGEGADSATLCATLPPTQPPDPPQYGLNFIRFFWSGTGYDVASLTPLIEATGADALRQLHKGDPRWALVEATQDLFDFSTSDPVLFDAPQTRIVTLYSLYWQSPTPPWSSVLVPAMNADCEDYLRRVVRRYKDVVTYWELGNEMERWSWFDPGNSPPDYANLPPYDASAGFSTDQQGAFLAATAQIIREEDPDAQILLPGLSGMDGWSRSWLLGVVQAAGTDWFDIVSYHFYSPWDTFLDQHADFVTFLDGLGLGAKPRWMTETGVTSDPTLDIRTDYPNSPEQQAADVFRRPLLAYGVGDMMVDWHTFIGGGQNPTDNWRLYGLHIDDADRTPQPALYSYQLFQQELLPFATVQRQTPTTSTEHVYLIKGRDGAERTVAWGVGAFTVPAGMGEWTSVYSPDGSFTWQSVSPGQSMQLSDTPILLRPATRGATSDRR